MCKIFIIPAEDKKDGEKEKKFLKIGLLQDGKQIRPIIKELTGLNLKREEESSYDFTNLAYEIVYRIMGREIAKSYSFSKLYIIFDGEEQDKKTQIILQILLPRDAMSSINGLKLFSRDVIGKAIREGKIDNGLKDVPVRIDEPHAKIINLYYKEFISPNGDNFFIMLSPTCPVCGDTLRFCRRDEGES